jgi:Tol biopolymer transport system component
LKQAGDDLAYLSSSSGAKMKLSEDKIYEFGPFRLDASTHRLLRDGEQISLRRKSYEILLLLVSRSGELIEKDELFDRIWPDQIIDESNLTQHIYRLRIALGDNPKTQDYILTVPGKGYSFNKGVRVVKVESVSTDFEIESEADSADEDVEVEDLANGRAGLNTWPGILMTRRGVTSMMVIGIALIIIIVVSVTIQFRHRSNSAEKLNVPRTEPLVTLPGLESNPAFSPDGRYIAFTSEGESQDNQDIYVRVVDQDILWRVTSHPNKDTHVTWSPDGTKLAFLRNSAQFTERLKVMVVPVRGGGEVEIAEAWGGLDWSPDGRHLAISDNEGLGTATGLYLINNDGRERKNLTTPPVSVFDTYPRFSPDGRKLAFLRWKNNNNADLYLLTLDGGILTQLTFDQKRIPDLRWDPGGEAVYIISNRGGENSLWRIPIDGGDPVFMAFAPVDLESIAISPDGKFLAFTQALSDTVIDIVGPPQASPDGRIDKAKTGTPTPVCTINSSRGDDTPRFSSDGSKIAFISTRTGWDEIWVANSDCSGTVQLTHFQQHGVGSPRWSPDGQRIVFDRNLDENADIFTIRSNGTELLRLTSDKAIENMPSWSGDGQWIYFCSYKNAVSQIFKISVNGGNPIQVTTNLGREPLESPDGKTLYFTSRDRMWQKDLVTGSESPIIELADITIGRYWDLGLNSIFYVPQTPGLKPIIYQFELVGRRRLPLLDIPGSLSRWVPGIAISPARNHFAMSYVTYRYGDLTLVKGWK